MVAHACSPSIWKAKARKLSGAQGGPIYMVSYRQGYIVRLEYNYFKRGMGQ